jgi:hypothetical protein
MWAILLSAGLTFQADNISAISDIDTKGCGG